jgi:hypothetical protein
MINEYGEPLWKIIDRCKTEELGEKSVPVSLCQPQTPHELTWARTRTSAPRGRQLAARTISRPHCHLTSKAGDIDSFVSARVVRATPFVHGERVRIRLHCSLFPRNWCDPVLTHYRYIIFSLHLITLFCVSNTICS